MRLTLLATLILVAGVIVFNFTQANAEESSVIGPGKNTCSEFLTVVDGDWSYPLNALHFHGYIAWAQGMISGHNQSTDEPPVMPNADELKMTLVDHCRDNPDVKYVEAVNTFFTK